MFKILLTLTSCIIGGVFWRMGGSKKFPSWIRGVGIASLFMLIALNSYLASAFPFITWWKTLILLGLTGGVTWGLLTISYGITSSIGKLFSSIMNSVLRDICIRGLCVIIWSITYLIPLLFTGQWLKIFYCLVPIILMPIIRVSEIQKLNPHIEEVLMGMAYTLGYILIWI